MWGAWVALSVEHLTVDFSSGHDLTVLWLQALLRALHCSSEPAWDFPLSAPPLLTLSLSLKNKTKQKKHSYMYFLGMDVQDS